MTKEKTFIVSYGDKVVEMWGSGLSETQAKLESDTLSSKGYRNVRIRLEDPNYPTWPLNFDLQ